VPIRPGHMIPAGVSRLRTLAPVLGWPDMAQQALRSRLERARRTLLLGGAVLLACACAEADSCPAISPGTVQPAVVETSAELLTSTPGIVQLVVSGGGLYWHNGFSIWALLPGQAPASVLYALPLEAAAAGSFDSEFRTITGLFADADHLYWGESTAYAGGFVGGYSPPGRLLSMPQAGGAVQVLLELSDRAVTPVAVDDTSVIVQLSGAAGYHRFIKLDETLAPLVTPAVYETSRVVGDEIYWTEPGVEHPQLFRANIGATQPERIARIESSEYDVGPGYVLWRHERVLREPELLLDQNFMVWRADSGCVQALPGAGESISYATARDDRSVYWHSFNALGSVSLYIPAEGASPSEGMASPLPEMPLLRLDLNTGRIERLESDGFPFVPGAQILGMDAERLFVSTQAGLVAVRR